MRKKGSIVLLLGLASGLISNQARAIVNAWADSETGEWELSANWSQHKVPNNNVALGLSYDAVIDAVGAPYTVYFSSSAFTAIPRNTQTTIDSLTLSSADATFHMSGGSLTTLNGITINAGTFDLDNGRVSGSIGGSGGTLLIGDGFNTLDNVTLRRTALLREMNSEYPSSDYPRSFVTVQNGLTFDGGAIVGAGSPPEKLVFTGTQTLSGSGSIAGASVMTITGGTLTVGSGVQIANSQIIDLTDAGAGLVNQGTLVFSNPAATYSESQIRGSNLVNQGSILLSNGAAASLTVSSGLAAGTMDVRSGALLQLGNAAYRLADLGTLTTDATGRIELDGICDDPGATLATSATLRNVDFGGTLSGIHIDNRAAGNARLVGGTLQDVTIAGDVTASAGTIGGILTLSDASRLIVDAPGYRSATVTASAGASIVGSGSIELNGGGNPALTGADFTVAETVPVNAAGSNAAIIGTSATARPRIDSALTVTGTLRTENITTTGPINVGSTGLLKLGAGDYQQSVATIAAGGVVQLDGAPLAQLPAFPSSSGQIVITAACDLAGGTIDLGAFGPSVALRTDTGALSNGTLVLTKPLSFASGFNDDGRTTGNFDRLGVVGDLSVAATSDAPYIRVSNGLAVHGRLAVGHATIEASGTQTIAASSGIWLSGNASLVASDRYLPDPSGTSLVTIAASSTVDVVGANNSIVDDPNAHFAIAGLIHVHGSGSSLELKQASKTTFAGTLNVNDHARVTLSGNFANAGTIDLSDGAFGYQVNPVGAAFTNTGRIQIGDASLYLVNVAPATVRSQVSAGFGDGTWNGTSGIFLSPDAGQPAIGYISASLYAQLRANWTFNGVSLTSGGVVLLPAVPGDTNLDGAVNFSDLLRIAKAYGTTGSAVWSDGDFDYNGTVDFADMLSLARRYGRTFSASDSAGLPVAVAADFALAQSLVPEPAWIGLCSAALMLSTRRPPRRVVIAAR